MDLGINRQDLYSKIQKQAGNRWRGGERTVDLDNGIKAIVQTKSVGERLKTLFNTKEPRVYETVIITDAKGQKIDGCNFTLSKFGIKARTEELAGLLSQELPKIISSTASSNPPPALGTSSPAPQNLTPKPINAETPQSTPKSPTPIHSDAIPTATAPTVTPEAAIAPELQTILNKPAEELTEKDIDHLISLRDSLNRNADTPITQEMQAALDLLPSALCEWIKGNPTPSTNYVMTLVDIYDNLDKNSSKAKTIEKTVIDNFSAIGKVKTQNRWQDEALNNFTFTIATPYAQSLSVDNVSDIARRYKNASQAKISESQLNCALLGLNDKIEHNFDNITPEDTKKLQIILSTLPKEAIVWTTYDKMNARLQALQALQNKHSSAEELSAAQKELQKQGTMHSPLGIAIKNRLLEVRTTAVPPEPKTATISPELQTTMPSPDEAKKLAEDYCNPTSSNKQELEKQLNNMLETLDKTAATNPQEVQKIANAVNNVLRGSIRKLKSSAPQELTNLQATAETLRKKAVNFINADTYIDNINNGTQQRFDHVHASALKQAAMDTNFPRHEEALQALMKVASKSCENIQEKGFFNVTNPTLNNNYNLVSHLQCANDALKEIFAENPSKQFTQLQETIGNTISKACQEFCNVIDTTSKDEEKFSPQDINNLCLLKRTLSKDASMPEPMQNAFNKATTELCGRIQGKDNPSVADVAMLNSIHDVLNDDSAECQDIEKTFFENRQIILAALQKKDQEYYITKVNAIAEKHVDHLSAQEVTNLANKYTQSVEAHGAQTENLKAQLNLTLKVIDNKLDYDFEHITSEDTQKLQILLQTLSPEGISSNVTRQAVDAKLRARQVLQNASSVEDFASALKELENTGNRTRTPLYKALEAKLPADPSAPAPIQIQNLSKEALQQLDEETFKNLPEDAERLTSKALQDLLDNTSLKDMERYAEVYAAGFKKRQWDDNDQVESKLNVIVQAIGQKLLKGIDQISNDDVQKLQVIVNATQEHSVYTLASMGRPTENRLQALKALQEVQNNIDNSTIGNIDKLVRVHEDLLREFRIVDGNPFVQAIQNALVSNIEKVFSGPKIEIASISSEDVKSLVDAYWILGDGSTSRETIGSFLATNQEKLKEQFTGKYDWNYIGKGSFDKIIAQHTPKVG